MRNFVPHSALLAIYLALAGCAGVDREPVDWLRFGEVFTDSMEICTDRLFEGVYTSFEETVLCEGEINRAGMERLKLDYAFGDLVALRSDWRLRLARRLDAGAIDIAESSDRQIEFDIAFMDKLAVRERLHNSGARAIEFNVCEVEGDGLRCTAQTATREILKQFGAVSAECERKYDLGYLKDTESLSRCAYEDGLVAIYERNQFPHMKLVRLYARYMTGLGRRQDEGQITLRELERKLNAMAEQYDAELKRRDALRAAGDLNWRNRSCGIAGERLVCVEAALSI